MKNKKEKLLNFFVEIEKKFQPDFSLENYLSGKQKLSNPFFNDYQYLNINNDVKNSGFTALEHFIRFGFDEKRKFNVFLNDKIYKNTEEEFITTSLDFLNGMDRVCFEAFIDTWNDDLLKLRNADVLTAISTRNLGICSFFDEAFYETQARPSEKGISYILSYLAGDWKTGLLPNGNVETVNTESSISPIIEHYEYIQNYRVDSVIELKDNAVHIQILNGKQLNSLHFTVQIDTLAFEIDRNAIIATAHGSLYFSMPVPEAFYDGKLHTVMILNGHSRKQVTGDVLIFPKRSTSVDLLLEYAKNQTQSYGNSELEALRHKLIAESAVAASKIKNPQDVYTAILDPLKFIRNGAQLNLQTTKSEKPTCTLIIPVHNNLPMTLRCLATLQLAARNIVFDVIIVDDGSQDETRDLAKFVRCKKIIRHDTALGFLRSVNEAARLVSTDYLVILNNDMEFTPGWLDALRQTFDDFPNAGIVGGKLVYPDGKLQEAGGIVYRNGTPCNFGKFQSAFHPHFNYAREADYVSGACLMISKQLWDDLGGFDDDLAPAYYEDTDICFRVRAAGYSVMYQPAASVFHLEGQSNGTDVTGSGLKRYQAINEPKFKRRWANTFSHHYPQDNIANNHRDRYRPRQVIMIDHEFPQADRNAGGYAAINEARMFVALGFKVTFIPANLAYLPGYVEELQRIGVECVYHPYAPSMEQALEQYGAQCEIVYITRYNIARSVLHNVRRLCPNARIILNNADLHFLRELRQAIAADDNQALDNALAVRNDELEVMRQVDLVLTYSSAEKAVIESHNLNSTMVGICPWVEYPRTNIPGFSDRSGIGFLGGFRHPPNRDAMEHFIEHVWPAIRARNPDLELFIAGADSEGLFDQYRDIGVVPLGRVASTDEFFARIKLFIAPLRVGAGVKGKVIAAMANGVPCLLSPIAAEGIRTPEGSIVVSEIDAGWADHINNLIAHEKPWTKHSEQLVEACRNAYSFDTSCLSFNKALNL